MQAKSLFSIDSLSDVAVHSDWSWLQTAIEMNRNAANRFWTVIGPDRKGEFFREGENLAKIKRKFNPFCPTDIGADPNSFQRTCICSFSIPSTGHVMKNSLSGWCNNKFTRWTRLADCSLGPVFCFWWHWMKSLVVCSLFLLSFSLLFFILNNECPV